MIAKDEKIKRALFWVPARLYELAVRLRVAAYETDYLKPKRLDATVISVGNITLGGTGKTPLVEYIARFLKEQYHEVAILTRGYGRSSQGRRVLKGKAPDEGEDRPAQRLYEVFGDEPLMLARSLEEVPIIIDSNRYEGGRFAEKEFGSRALILDDGYQHLALARDLNILLLDATDPFGEFEMAPFGRLREPLYGMRRADLVIITRADRPFDQGQTLALIRYFCGDRVPVLFVYSSIARLRHLLTGETYDADQFSGWNVAVLCGIGNPRAFSEDILQMGINIASEHFFADHHAYTQEDLDRVLETARELGVDAVVTTEKDAVRLEGLRHGDIPLYAAQLEIESQDDVKLKSLLLKTIIRKTQ
ncbi:MAG TPA: tetraacyldisaccharide 4'-kinase [Blastocatellia bacterium]|nr:tetraacyldisaccharide 4'-kinase [Blastocatellia bacterium]